MRKSLSLLLAIAMVFSMFSSLAFAADEVALTAQQKYDALAAKGIFAGINGEAALDQNMNRAQFARVAALILGLENVSATDTTFVTAKPFSDVELGLWYTDEIAAAKEAGVFVGNADGTFNPKGDITVQELAVVAAGLLGLEEVKDATVEGAAPWAAGYIKALLDAKVDFPTNYTEAAKRSDLASLAFQADAAINPVVPVVTTATKVASVSATNVKQIFVAFDGEVTKASAEDASNYSTDAGAIKSASLSDDLKTVTLTLDTGVTMTNQKEYKVSVLKVKAGTSVIEAKDVKFTVLDNTLPVVDSVSPLGNKALKLNVSEPVKSTSSTSIKIDDKSFFGTITTDGSTITLKPYNTTTVLTNGAHTITVSNIEDFQGLKSLIQTIDFTVVEDKAAPVVVEASATLETATIEYDEDIDPDTVATSDFHFLVGTAKKNPKAATVSGKKVTLDFTNNVLPAYTTTLFVGQIADYSGNATASSELSITATVDQSRPEVADVKANDAKTHITVKFNKNVTGAVKASYSIKDKDAKNVSVKDVTGSDKTFVIELYAALPAGTNTLSISGIADTTTLKNVMLPYSTEIAVGDTTGPTFSSASAKGRQIIVNFNEVMNLSSIANPENYLIKYNGSYRKVPAGTEFTPILGGKSILIVLAEKIDTTVLAAGTTVSHLQVMGVEDTSGNKLNPYIHEVDLGAASAAALLAQYDSANGITDNAILEDGETIKVKFNQPIGTVTATDFTTTNGTIATAKADGTDVVTIKLTSSLGTSIGAFTATIAVGNKIESVTGNTVVGGVAVTIKDKVAPKLQLATNQTTLTTTQPTATSAVIIVPVSETLIAGPTFAHDLIVTRLSDSKVLTALDDYTTTSSVYGIEVAISSGAIKTSKYSVAIKANASYIKDLAGNTAAESSAYESNILIDATVPTVVSAKIIDATSFQVVFSEAVNAVVGDFTTYAYDADGAGAGTPVATAVSSITGSGTNTIVVTTAATAFASGVGTGTVNIAATVLDLKGNALAAITAQAIATN